MKNGGSRFLNLDVHWKLLVGPVTDLFTMGRSELGLSGPVTWAYAAQGAEICETGKARRHHIRDCWFR